MSKTTIELNDEFDEDVALAKARVKKLRRKFRGDKSRRAVLSEWFRAWNLYRCQKYDVDRLENLIRVAELEGKKDLLEAHKSLRNHILSEIDANDSRWKSAEKKIVAELGKPLDA